MSINVLDADYVPLVGTPPTRVPIEDGLTHKLSTVFPDLPTATAFYPFVTTLDQMDRETAWAAIQKAVNAAIVNRKGDAVYVPAGTYAMNSTIEINYVSGLNFGGDSRGRTVLEWLGEAEENDIPMFRITNTRESYFHDFTIHNAAVSSPDYVLKVGISQYRDNDVSGFSPTYNSYDRVTFDGGAGGSTSGIVTCFQTGGQDEYDDQNNDFTLWKECRFLNYRDYGVHIQGSQNYYNQFIHCAAHSAGPDDQTPGGLAGVYQNNRSGFTWEGGSMLGHSVADFVIENMSPYSATVIRNMTSEGSNRFIDLRLAYMGVLLTEGVRWTGNKVNSDGQFIKLINFNGKGIFRGNIFKELPTAITPEVVYHKLRVNWTSAGVTRTREVGSSLRFEDNIYTQNETGRPNAPEQPDDPAQGFFMFVNNPPTHWSGNQIVDENDILGLPWAYTRKKLAVNDTTPTIRQWDEYTVTNTVATTITNFDDGYLGSEVTLYFTNGNTTVQDGANIQLAGSGNFVSAADAVLCLRHDGTKWVEKYRN